MAPQCGCSAVWRYSHASLRDFTEKAATEAEIVVRMLLLQSTKYSPNFENVFWEQNIIMRYAIMEWREKPSRRPILLAKMRGIHVSGTGYSASGDVVFRGIRGYSRVFV